VQESHSDINNDKHFSISRLFIDLHSGIGDGLDFGAACMTAAVKLLTPPAAATRAR
jgi:hypothetical protein